MRLPAATLAALALAAPGGDWAAASYATGRLTLRLHYLMTCGQPGPGPLVVRLPAAFRVRTLRVTVRGVQRPASASGSTVTIELAKPPEVTCMSIAEGVLPVTIAHVHARAGTYVVRAQLPEHAFAARLRIG